MIKITAAAILAYALLIASAYADSIIYTPVSYHLDRSESRNEVNHAVGIEVNRYVALTFNNSNSNRSWFLGYDFASDPVYLLVRQWHLRGHFYAGALYGYGEYMPSIEGWSIGAAASAELCFDRWSVMVMGLPADGGVLALGFLFNF